MAAAVEAKARPPQAPRRLIKECRRHGLFVPFKVRKGKLSRKVCSVYHRGMNWAYTWVTHMHAHAATHCRWSISVSYCKWFLNEWIELYIVGTQAKVFSDFMRLQGAHIICAQGTLLLSYFAPCKCGRGCFVNLTPLFPRSGVEVTGVSRFIQPQTKTKGPTENDHLTVAGAQRQFWVCFWGFSPAVFYWNRVYKLGHGGLGGKVCSLNFPWRLNSAVIDAASFAARLTGHTERLLFGPCLSATVFAALCKIDTFVRSWFSHCNLLHCKQSPSISTSRLVPQNMHIFLCFCNLSSMNFCFRYLSFKAWRTHKKSLMLCNSFLNSEQKQTSLLSINEWCFCGCQRMFTVLSRGIFTRKTRDRRWRQTVKAVTHRCIPGEGVSVLGFTYMVLSTLMEACTSQRVLHACLHDL